MNIEVKKIKYEETKDFILNKHYASRMPSITFSFGLFINSKLEGVLTIGKPASNPLCIGVCGKEYSSKVYELNRLITNENLPQNTLSYFVSKCLKFLKNEDLIIVSFADTGMNHNGYIYQATNFLYTGITKERTDKYMPGNKHARHYTEDYKHLRKVRTAKHRYIYFTNKKNKEMIRSLKYNILPYPKGINSNYVLGETIKTKILNKETNEYFYE